MQQLLDVDSLRARLTALVRSVFPDWSDLSVASFGNLLIETYAFVGDVVISYLDNQACESRLATATRRRNVSALARLLGYKLRGAQAATAVERIQLARPLAADLVHALKEGSSTNWVSRSIPRIGRVARGRRCRGSRRFGRRAVSGRKMVSLSWLGSNALG